MKRQVMLMLGLIVLNASLLFSQEKTDAKAKAILDELSVKTKTYSTIKADFTFTLEPKDTKKAKETQNGTVLIKGDKYKLDIKGQEVISDGKTMWTYLKDANEVQVNSVDPTSEDALSPSNIFTMYENGFKYKFEKEELQGKNMVQVINLYPVNPEKRKYHTIKLFIDKNKKQITAAKMLMKDGSTYSYNITSFNTSVAVNDTDFTFNAKAHAGVEVIDLRE